MIKYCKNICKLDGILVGLFVVSLTLLAGCGRLEPTEVVARAMAGLADLDAEVMAERFCAEEASQILSGAEAMADMRDQGANIELVAVRYELVFEDDERAVVEMTGTLKAHHPEEGDSEEFLSERVHLLLEDGQWKICGGFL